MAGLPFKLPSGLPTGAVAAGPTINECAGTPAGVATVVGTLDILNIECVGASAGTSTVAGALTLVCKVAASPSGSATVTATLLNAPAPPVEVAGTSDGVATASGGLILVHKIATLSTGVAIATGGVQGPDLLGSSAGVATVTGELLVPEARSARTSATVGVTVPTSLLASRAGRTSAIVGVTTPTAFVESRSGRVSVMVAASLIPHNLSGTSHGQALARLDNAHILYSTVAGQATVTGVIQNPGPEIYDTPGDSFTFEVPEYVYELEVKVWGGGAGGGGGASGGTGGDGGGGGFASTVIAVTPSETLDVFVGGGGDGGKGGVGVFSTSDADAGGGGGYSGLERTGTVLGLGAGGGGGGSTKNNAGQAYAGGGGGGATGADGPGGGGGGGGGQSAGGAAGGGNSTAGSALQGGVGHTGSTPRTPKGGINGGGDGGDGIPWPSYTAAGGGGGGGINGGGGGALFYGGGGGANRLTGSTVLDERASGRAAAGGADPDYPGGGVAWGGTGSGGDGGLGGSGYVFLSWSMAISSKLNASVIEGSATAQGTLDPVHSGLIPVPIPVDLLVEAGEVHELDALAAGQAAVSGWLHLVGEFLTGISGTSTTSGELTVEERNPDGTSDGSSTTQGVLQVGSGGVYPIELVGQSDGVGTVHTVHSVLHGSPLEQKRYIYQYVSIGVAFDGIDFYNGPADPGVVSYGYPDGDPQADFKRFLMQLVNIGVAFDDTDDITTRTVGDINPYVDTVVSQPFPDGDIHLDWSRHLYQFLQVVEGEVRTGRLTIGPVPHRDTWRPYTKPPTSEVRSKGPVSSGPRTSTTVKSVRKGGGGGLYR